ncbi:type II toxin-antitoxin system Phd/YefM family antitoxin [Planococcus lenghuensis]|uniref:Antitoxin n=1 Tax=Planococcus lenghuensis TaxID=2213202 RepID=A0A1Q2L4A0_9BACL|nr:type II toxin-antitoxin system Phd/YefM family antitoxin [Planococcus lenghuensis]AQQ54682.1 hypothetical protein B0X71_17285 [Planococcus lenghuensis]
MLKTADVKVQSISGAKRDFSKIIKEVVGSGQPTFVFNRNEPAAVILSNDMYESLVRRCRELEDELYGDKEKRFSMELFDE